MDLEKIKKNYSNFDDFRIEKLAKYEANSLEPEVLEILKSEIRNRGLDENWFKAMDVQSKELT